MKEPKIAKLNLIAEKTYQIVIITFMFIIFTIFGLVVFGFGPSYYASNKMIMDWRKGVHGKLFPTFFSYFKEQFWANNLIFIGYILSLIIIFFNSRYFYKNIDQSIINSFGLLANIFMFIFITNGIMVYPSIKVEYELKWKNTMVFAFKLPWAVSLQMIKTYLFWIISVIALVLMPQLTAFIFVGILIYTANSLGIAIIKKINNKVDDDSNV